MHTLFKYVSTPHSILNDGYIRATQLSALNDPFEGTYCKIGLSELARHFYDNDENEVKDLIAYIEESKNKVGIISLTESKDNLLMWAHYGNEHRGVVLGFMPVNPIIESVTMLQDLFISSDPWSDGGYEYTPHLFSGRALPVIYRKQPRYRVDAFDYDYSSIFGQGKDRILFEIFQQKSDEWIYEKEHRITLKLAQANRVIIHDIENLNNEILIDNILKNCRYTKEVIESKNIYTFYLEEINDESYRNIFGNSLAKLSINPKNIYLFKLSSSSICQYYQGLKCTQYLDYDDCNHALSSGFFSTGQAILNSNHYTLDFEDPNLIK